MFSLPSLMQSKRKYIIIFLVSLPTLSNPDREHGKEAVLSAHEHAESRVLLFTGNGGTGKATSSSAPEDGYATFTQSAT